jgi:hypothetical protein
MHILSMPRLQPLADVSVAAHTGSKISQWQERRAARIGAVSEVSVLNDYFNKNTEE